MSKRSMQRLEGKPWKLLLWAAFAGLIFGLVDFGEIAEDYLRTVRNSVHPHKASGQIIVVKVDDRALREIGNWPWPRRVHAQIIDALTAAGARQIFFDINFSYPDQPAQDRAFAAALKRSGRVTLATRFKAGSQEGKNLNSRPLPGFAKNAHLATLSFRYNYQNAVWQLP